MRVFLFLVLLSSVLLVSADYPPPSEPDPPDTQEGIELQLLSASSHLAMEVSDLAHEVNGEVSYKRSQTPATRLANTLNSLVRAVEEGAECQNIRVLVQSTKHRFNVLRRAFERDHEVWGIARLGWSFNSMLESFRVFDRISGRYLSTRSCYQER